ncbi:hypothetical protein DJ480_17275 [Pseudomonas sp. Leaf98]|nr:hypothetical protein DJ480_17275 [Pseudomonas sp. Leaf98]
MIVPTLCVGMPLVTLRVTPWDAERPGLHSHAERGNDQRSTIRLRASTAAGTPAPTAHRRSGCCQPPA